VTAARQPAGSWIEWPGRGHAADAQDAFGQVFAGKAQKPGRAGDLAVNAGGQDRFKGHLFVG